jgi:hypothetical protein
MKKVLVFAFAALVIVAYSFPAMAKVKMGGIVFVDAMFIKNDEMFQRNSAAITSAANSLDASRSWFTIDVPGKTRLYGKWTNDAGNVGMHIEIGLRGEEGGGEAVRTRYAYGWWKINPMFKLTVGQQVEVIAPYKTGTMLGGNGKLAAGTAPGHDTAMFHSGCRGFGNIGQDRKEGIRLDTKLGEKSNLAFAIYTPNVTNGLDVWAAADEENVLPRVDITFSTSLGAFSFAPGFSWQKIEYEWDPQAAGGMNDWSDFDAWVWALPVMWAPGGPFRIKAELTWGENLGNGSWNTGRYGNRAPNNALGAGADFDAVDGNRIVCDTEFTGFWVDFAWKVSPIVCVHFTYGLQQVKNDDRVADANRWDNTRVMYGIRVPVKVAKNMTIRPEVSFYDYGEFEQGGIVDPQNGELGSQILMGVEFRIAF